ncbi:hypothetical protein HN51_041215 [Arachis hypogaea]
MTVAASINSSGGKAQRRRQRRRAPSLPHVVSVSLNASAKRISLSPPVRSTTTATAVRTHPRCSLLSSFFFFLEPALFSVSPSLLSPSFPSVCITRITIHRLSPIPPFPSVSCRTRATTATVSFSLPTTKPKADTIDKIP